MASSPGGTMYAIQDVPGKGKGLIATRKIVQGTRIICEEPILKVPNVKEDIGLTGRSLFLRLLTSRVEALSPNKLRQFLALFNPLANVPALKYFGTIQVNGLELDSFTTAARYPSLNTNAVASIETEAGDDDFEEVGVFAHASRINHDCEGNVYNSWNGLTKRYTIHALQDIEKGEEITINYIESHIPRHERQARLRVQYKFNCTCRLCTLPSQQSQKHDNNMMDLRKHRLDTLGYLDTLEALEMAALHFPGGGCMHAAMMPTMSKILESMN